MSARDELARLLFIADNSDAPEPDHEWEMTIRHNPGHAQYAYVQADAILAAGYSKPRAITTAEDLDKLGFQSVVLDAYGTPYVCERHATDGTRNEWKPSGMNHLDESEEILYHGPATVVHEGERS